VVIELRSNWVTTVLAGFQTLRMLIKARSGLINVLVSRTGPLTYELKTEVFPVSAGLGGYTLYLSISFFNSFFKR
jgi:hypothetical protein